MDVPPLAAHLFVFYYGALADVTPPTALSSYTAAGIAGADPQRTTWIAWKLAMAGFIIPYYFTTNPVLLLNVVPVTPLGLAQAVLSAVADNVEIRNVIQVDVVEDRNTSVAMLFDAGRSLEERVLAEQFSA